MFKLGRLLHGSALLHLFRPAVLVVAQGRFRALGG